MGDATTDRPGVPFEHRRGSRFHVVVPIEAKWQEPNGTTVEERGEAREVNSFGGLLEIKTYPRVGAELEITNLVSHETVRARVAAVRRDKDGAVLGVAVELRKSSDGFWGLNFQLRKTSDELVRIEQAIKAGGVDARILTDFRDAVDYVRKTAWAVQEWQERQFKQHDPQTVLPLITAERIRRTTQLSKAIMIDLAAHDVTRNTPGIEDLFRAVETLHQHVAGLFGGS
ncbi:MAG TPA: hypothetical protein VFW94_13755 [Candidatus Acidoferrales bacterium]|nr:hypothetical protein [Candidatus Acidoferrales bacterium]